MFLPIILLSLLILIFPAVTSFDASRSKHGVPLKRISNIVDKHGVVNPISLQNQVQKVSNKLQRGFRAYHKNIGSRHPSDTKKHSKRDTAAILLSNNDSSIWQGSVYIGTPPVSFVVAFDTGSGDFFLPGGDCNINCDHHRKYATNISSTAKDLKKPFKLSFGDNSFVSGRQFTDTVTIGGLTATNQTIGSASKYSDGFTIQKFLPDGLMGMGFPEVANFGTNPVFHNLMAQNQPTQPVFAFKLTPSDSELFLGGVNHDLYVGNFTLNPVTRAGFWQIELEAVNIFNRAIVKGKTAIIDTGTTLILGDTKSVAKFYGAIAGSKPAPSKGDGFYSVPCDAIPSISMTFGGENFTISSESFNIGYVSENSTDCIGGIAGANDLSDFWVVGDVFLQNVYTAFNVKRQIVGFANLA